MENYNEQYSTILHDLPNEIWKNIPKYYGKYKISNKGRLKSCYKNKQGILLEKICKGALCGSGYRQASLTKDKKIKFYSFHRLIAEAFISNPKNKPCVNHINGIKTDNRIENLEWCTYLENTTHAKKLGLCLPPPLKGIFGKENPTSKAVQQLNEKGKLIKQWDSMRIAGNSLDIFPNLISLCCSNKIKTAGGFKWKKIKNKQKCQNSTR